MQSLASYILAIEGYPSPVSVISQSNEQQKSFSNLCQQSFWIKMQQGLAVTPQQQPKHKQT